MNIDQYIKLLDAVLRRTDLANPTKLLFCQATLQPSIREGWFYGAKIDRLAEEFGLTLTQLIASCASLAAVDLFEIKYDISGTVSIGFGLGAKSIAGIIPPPPSEMGETQTNDTYRNHKAQRSHKEAMSVRDIAFSTGPTATEFAEKLRQILADFKNAKPRLIVNCESGFLMGTIKEAKELLRRHDEAVAACIQAEVVKG